MHLTLCYGADTQAVTGGITVCVDQSEQVYCTAGMQLFFTIPLYSSYYLKVLSSEDCCCSSKLKQDFLYSLLEVKAGIALGQRLLVSCSFRLVPHRAFGDADSFGQCH